MAATLWVARLDSRTKRQVLCGRRVDGKQVCRGVIGEVCEEGVRRNDNPSTRRVLAFAPGFAADAEGIWHRTPRAEQRIKHGRAPQLRRPPRPVLMFNAGATRPTNVRFLTPPSYPAMARCPQCRALNELRADVLDVEVLDLVRNSIRQFSREDQALLFHEYPLARAIETVEFQRGMEQIAQQMQDEGHTFDKE